jgi:hypothetical protein
MENVNEKHKDTVFTFLFSNPALLRELYSAIEGITLPPTINNNMPIRCLIYISKLYEGITGLEDRFKRKLGKIPKPEFIVLYNGTDEYPDYEELRLSDAFVKTDKIKIDLPLELVVQVYNINKGRNQEILSKSKTLDNYSRFIDKIREYQKEYQWKYTKKDDKKKLLDKAFRSAIKYCIKNDILRDFLRKHGSEVLNMLYAEYDPEVEMRVVREEALEEARKEDYQYFLELLNQGLTIEEIKERLNKKEVFNEARF